MINTTKIYLVTNCYNDLNKVYIGKEKSEQRCSREYAHKCTFGKQISFTYIDEVNSLKYEDWEPLETFWINYFKFLGFELMNKRKKGGSGPEICTEETKQKIKKSLIGRKCTEETKIKISRSKLGVKSSEETKLKISKSNLGRKYTEDQKQKMRKPKSNTANMKAPKLTLRKPVDQYDKNGVFKKTYASINEANLALGKNPYCGDISLCCLGKRKLVNGFIWKWNNPDFLIYL
jgi:hypothetical protein